MTLRLDSDAWLPALAKTPHALRTREMDPVLPFVVQLPALAISVTASTGDILRTLHRATILGGTLAISVLSFTYSYASGRSASLAISAREARVDSLVQAGRTVEAFSEGVRVLRESVEKHDSSSPEVARALRCLAYALRELGDHELAASVFHLLQLVATDALDPCDPLVISVARENEILHRRLSQTSVDVIPVSRNSLSLLDVSVPEHRDIAGQILFRLGIYYWGHDLNRSVETLEEAVQVLETAPDRLLCCGVRGWLGWTLLQLGRHDEARYHLERARDEMTIIDPKDPNNVAWIDEFLGGLAVVSGDWTSAGNYFRESALFYAQKRAMGSTRISEVPLTSYSYVALADLKRGRPTEAWESLQRQRGILNKRLLTLNRSTAGPKGARIRQLRKEVDEDRALRRQWKLPDTADAIDWPGVIRELDVNAELFRLEAESYAPDVTKVVSLEELQSVLPDNYAYIGYLNCRFADGFLASPGRILDVCWMYVIRSRGPVHWIPLWEYTSRKPMDEFREPVGTYGLKMARAAGWNFRVEDDPSLAPLARTIAEEEFDPALPFLEGVDCLVTEFFEDRTAWKPLETLVLPDGTYVGDRFDVAYTPTADAFVASRRSKTSAGSEVLVIGDPVFDELASAKSTPVVDWRDAGKAPEEDIAVHRAAVNGDVDAILRLPPLRYSKLEIDHIRKVFPDCTMLCGSDATEANVRRVLQDKQAARFNIIHIATHALSESSLQHRYSLALAPRNVDGSPTNDALVDALEIQLGWHLDADLVTLSGCRTLAGERFSFGEPFGLAGVMLGAGARSVLATYWEVDDLAAARLNARFYENLTGRYLGNPDGRSGKPMTKAAALSEAKRWLRNFTDEKGKKPFAHPVYWSGFVLIGSPD